MQQESDCSGEAVRMRTALAADLLLDLETHHVREADGMRRLQREIPDSATQQFEDIHSIRRRKQTNALVVEHHCVVLRLLPIRATRLCLST